VRQLISWRDWVHDRTAPDRGGSTVAEEVVHDRPEGHPPVILDEEEVNDG
jgi:hypothetical protein